MQGCLYDHQHHCDTRGHATLTPSSRAQCRHCRWVPEIQPLAQRVKDYGEAEWAYDLESWYGWTWFQTDSAGHGKNQLQPSRDLVTALMLMSVNLQGSNNSFQAPGRICQTVPSSRKRAYHFPLYNSELRTRIILISHFSVLFKSKSKVIWCCSSPDLQNSLVQVKAKELLDKSFLRFIAKHKGVVTSIFICDRRSGDRRLDCNQCNATNNTIVWSKVMQSRT